MLLEIREVKAEILNIKTKNFDFSNFAESKSAYLITIVINNIINGPPLLPDCPPYGVNAVNVG